MLRYSDNKIARPGDMVKIIDPQTSGDSAFWGRKGDIVQITSVNASHVHYSIKDGVCDYANYPYRFVLVERGEIVYKGRTNKKDI